MVIMWVLFGVAMTFIVLLRVFIWRQRNYERRLAERRAEIAALRAARAARDEREALERRAAEQRAIERRTIEQPKSIESVSADGAAPVEP